MRYWIAALVLSVSLIGVTAPAQARQAPTYFQPGTTCNVHWDGQDLRIRFVNNTSHAGYLHCLFRLSYQGGSYRNVNDWMRVGAYSYRYGWDRRAIVEQAKSVKITGSYIRY